MYQKRTDSEFTAISVQVGLFWLIIFSCKSCEFWFMLDWNLKIWVLKNDLLSQTVSEGSYVCQFITFYLKIYFLWIYI